MAQKIWREDDKLSAATEASVWARRIVGREAGGGNIEDAMRRVESKTGIGFNSLRSLWYGRAKEVTADLWLRMRHAYLASCERQIAHLQHEIAVEAARGNDDIRDLAAEADALAQKVKAARR